MLGAAAYPPSPTPSISLLPVPATAKRLHTGVLAQLRTTGKGDDEFNQESVGSIGHAVLTASSKPMNQLPIRKELQSQPQQLSGSDVLRALNKAAAEKSKKKNKKSITTARAGRDGKIIKGEKVTKTVPDVPPLRVKEEWGIRLEQLQNRLDERKLETI